MLLLFDINQRFLFGFLMTTEIVKNSKYQESWDILYENYVKLEERHRPQGYVLQYSFYVQGSRDAYILLSSAEKPVETDDVVEIRKCSIQLFGNS